MSLVKVFYTKHAKEKLTRTDIKKFKVTKALIKSIVSNSNHKTRSKYGEFAQNKTISERHVLRVIYDIIGEDIKIITFHIARKGRYDET